MGGTCQSAAVISLYTPALVLYNALMADQKISFTKLNRLHGFLREVVFHFSRDRVFVFASSVVYSTLISMVPFLAFTMALLSAFGALTEVQAYIQEYVLAQFGEAAETGFVELVEGFLLNAGSLGVIGLISFLATSVFLLNRVWMTINHIFRTFLQSNLLIRAARFITVLVISTLLLSAYVSVWTIVRRELLTAVELDWALQFIRVIAPWIFMFLALFLIILLVPNTKVKKSSAALGAAVGVVFFQIANTVFGWIVNSVIDYSVIYGSFAALFVFLLWVYVLWVIVFLGAEVSYVHQYRPKRYTSFSLMETPSELLAHGVDILTEIARCYKEGSGAVNTRELSLRLAIPGEKLVTYIDILERSGFILRVERAARSYIPARPLEDIKVKDVIEALYGLRMNGEISRTPGHAAAGKLFQEGVSGIADQSIQEYVRRNTAKKSTKKPEPRKK